LKNVTIESLVPNTKYQVQEIPTFLAEDLQEIPTFLAEDLQEDDAQFFEDSFAFTVITDNTGKLHFLANTGRNVTIVIQMVNYTLLYTHTH
jgi:hypothetical protein